ncbi:MAG: glycoside hydrolase family 2 TIM barrel-domain containing protein [Bacteroidota bacterium]
MISSIPQGKLPLLLLVFVFSFHEHLAQQRTKQSINQNWKFHLGDADSAYFSIGREDASWKTVHIPHTLALTSLTLDGLQDEKTQLQFHRDVGWYRKDLVVGPGKDRKVFLEFEGAHQVTDLWVNGKHVGQHAIGGYTPFHFDITSFVNKGTSNQITLKVDNRRNEHVPPDPGPFDYVKFSGLYRDVYLVETSPLHITFDWEALKAGVYITTPTVDPINKNATLRMKTVVRNEYPEERAVELITRVIDKSGVVVLKLRQRASIPSGREYEFDQIGSIEDQVNLWSIDHPYLYRVNSQVLSEGEAMDAVENRMGIRTFALDPMRGFLLNGKPIELLGFNRHQQFPYVGDAVPNSLHYKDMLQFKEMGFNMVRTAHYPQDNALIEACDELGILVYEEAPTWIGVETDSLWWENLEQATRRMVRNHRNHPALVIWGGGVNHRGYVPRIHNAVKQEDPERLTASQGSRWTGWQSSGLTDINANMLYGPFIWDRSEPMFAMEGRRGPVEVAKHKRDPLMVGLISWTAHAYYTFHPSHDKADDPIDRTRSGAMTIFRYPRPDLMWYPSELNPSPFVYIKEEWKPGTEELTVYSNGDEVELLLNGNAFAKQAPSQDSSYHGLEHPPFHFDLDAFSPGTLTAKALKGDQVLAEYSRTTPGVPYALRIELDTMGRTFVADGSDILLAYAHVVDKQGTTLRDVSTQVKFSHTGAVTLIGGGEDINANPMFTEYGVAPVLLRAGTQPGNFSLTATAEGLHPDTVYGRVEPFQAVEAELPYYDFERIRVDLGAKDQLVQFGWTPWYGVDNQPSTFTFPQFGGLTAKLSSGSGSGILRWLGEMNVIGKYGYVYGDGIMGIDESGIVLSFEGLPKGTYKIKTWNHAPKSNSDHMDPNKEKLKSLVIDKIPYELELSTTVYGGGEDTSSITEITEGKNMQFDAVATVEKVFDSDGETPVEIRIQGANASQKGIWLNGFELSQWDRSIR